MLRRILLPFLVLVLTSCLALAQGSISGTIKDAKTGEAIIGANVIVEGTSSGEATDVEGNFTITQIAAGTYSLKVSSVTYKTHTIPSVLVEDGKKITLDITLSEDVSELTEVVIQAKRHTDTDFELLRSIKEAKLVVSGITAEQISRSLDRDAAQVLRRVPGITIVDNQFVQVRGLSSRYNPVMLHNTYAPSLETDVRSFSFAMIPSSQLERIMIYKSPSADNPGDFAGGVVKIFTKSIPDENSIVLDYSTQIRLGTTFGDFYHAQRGGSYLSGFNNGYYDLPGSFPSKISSSTQGEALIAAGRSLKNSWVPEKGKAIPDQRFTLTFNRKFNLGSVQVGNITAINYSNSFAVYTVTRGDYTDSKNTNAEDNQNFGYSDKQYNQQIRTGALFNWAFKFNSKHDIEFKNLYNQSSADQYVDRTGTGVSTGQKRGAFDKNYSGIYSGQLLGNHNLFNNRTRIEWVAGYNNSQRSRPDYRRYLSTNSGNGVDQVQITNQVVPEQLGRFYSTLNESAYSGGASIKQSFLFSDNPLNSPELKAGIFFENKSRTFNARNIGYVGAPGFSSNDPNSISNLPIGELFQPQNINNTAAGIQIGETTHSQDSYRASNNLFAYYLTASIPFSKKIKLDAGARVENNLQQLHSYNDFTSSPVNPKIQVNRLLPSANLSYNFTEKMLVRAAYGQTLNRPEFRELAPFTFFDFNLNYQITGNETLKTAKIQNLDLRWEFYPSKLELITFGGFYKNFDNAIESVIDPNSPGGGVKRLTYLNANSAVSYGLELEVKKSLSGMTASKFLDNINVLFNATVIKSQANVPENLAGGQPHRPLQGQAPYVINSGLFYNSEESGWQVNLLYNVVGKSIFVVGNVNYYNVYLMPRNVLDLTFSKRLTNGLQLKGGITDILNQPMTFLQDGNGDGKLDRQKDQNIQKYKPGQVVSIGFTWKIM